MNVAREVVRALGGHWHGSSGTARCPTHDDRTPSLSVTERDGRLLVNCHAGCDQATVWDAIHEIIRDIEGDWPRRPAPPPHPRPKPENDNGEYALAIWKESELIRHTPAHDYLLGRGITINPPPSLRFHPRLKHKPTRRHCPGLVAAVQAGDRRATAIQRTYLEPDDRGGYRKIQAPDPKMTLGGMTGGAVRLAHADDRVWLCEGVEDGLALHQMTGEPCWAVLGTSGFSNVELPEQITQVILAPDADEAGQASIEQAARRLAGQGRRVRTAQPRQAKDWCDALDLFEERAALLEFDYGNTRIEAEEIARIEGFQ